MKVTGSIALSVLGNIMNILNQVGVVCNDQGLQVKYPKKHKF